MDAPHSAEQASRALVAEHDGAARSVAFRISPSDRQAPMGSRTQQQRQAARSAHGAFGPAHRRVRVEPEFGNACEPLRERYSDFHAGQIGADAAMDAESE